MPSLSAGFTICHSHSICTIIWMYCGMQQVWTDRNKCKKYYSDLVFINFQLNGPLIPPPVSSFLEHKQLEAHYFSPQKHRHVIFKKKKFGFMIPISQQLQSFHFTDLCFDTHHLLPTSVCSEINSQPPTY